MPLLKGLISALLITHETASNQGDRSKQCCTSSRSDDNFKQNMDE
jgi:hypothetical protein